MSDAVNIRQLHVVVDAPAEAIFDFVSDLRNLPRWAFHFCKGVRLVSDGAIVTAPSGEVYFGTTGDRDLGVLDWWAGPTIEKAQRWPTRVVPLDGNRTLYTVTMIFGPTVPPAVEQHMTEELATLKRLVEAGAVAAEPAAAVA
jgi:hypothetical protein